MNSKIPTETHNSIPYQGIKIFGQDFFPQLRHLLSHLVVGPDGLDVRVFRLSFQVFNHGVDVSAGNAFN